MESEFTGTSSRSKEIVDTQSHTANAAQQLTDTSYFEPRQSSPTNSGAENLAKGLGIFSIGLGLAEAFAARRIGGLIGVGGDHAKLLPAMGVREMISGVGLLSQNRPSGWMWSRVAGDALNLGCLGVAMVSDKTNKRRLMAATGAVLGVTALDVYCAVKLSEAGDSASHDGAGLYH